MHVAASPPSWWRMTRVRTLLVGAAVALGLLTAASPAAAVNGLGALPPTTTVAPSSLSARLTLPSSVDLTAWAVPVGNQGSVGSCTGWAFAYNLAGWYARRAGLTETSFSPMFMYSQINVGASTSTDAGAYPVDALKLGRASGNDPKSDYPAGDYNWWTQPTSAQQLTASHYRFADPQVLASNPAGGMGPSLSTTIQTALAADQPVALEIRVRPGFDALSPSVTLDNDTTGTIRGLHEVIALGYDASGVLIQNQWGTSWGSGGFGRISWNVIEQDVLEADVISGLQRANAFVADASTNTLRDQTNNSELGWQQSSLSSYTVAAGSSPSAVSFKGQPHVFYVDSAHGNTISYATDNRSSVAVPWSNTSLGGDAVAAGTSPSAINVNGRAWVFYVDASKGNTIAAWSRGPTDPSWTASYFYGHAVSTGSSPSAVKFGGTPHVFFSDASNGNTITDWYLSGGWNQAPFSGHALSTGSSPSVVVANGGSTLYAFFADATASGTMSVWKWTPTTLGVTALGGHPLAAGSSPSALDVGGTPHAAFIDATNGNTISDWNATSSTTWNQSVLWGPAAPSGSSPATLWLDGNVQIFLPNAASSNQLSAWMWGSGLTSTGLGGASVATGSSPASL